MYICVLIDYDYCTLIARELRGGGQMRLGLFWQSQYGHMG